MAGRHRLDPLEQRVGIRNPEKGQELMQRFVVELSFDQAAGENRFYLGSENQREVPSLTVGLLRRIIQRLDADAIANQKERSLRIVPKRKGKHPIQTKETLFAPFSPGGQQDFGVALGAKTVALGSKFVAQLAIVVNLSVENNDQAAVVRKHRLVSGAAGIDDRQAPVTNTNAAPFSINGRGPHTFIVASAMLDCLQHRADVCFRILSYESGDAAH